MSRIINLSDATGVSDNDYVLLSSPTLGERKYKASKLVGGDPVLVTKTITENGTYNASSDDVEGYSSVTVEVSPTLTKILSALQPLSSSSPSSDYIWNANAPLNVTEVISGYLSYDSTNKQFTVLKDFTATLVPWVKCYYNSSSGNYGKLMINNQPIVGFTPQSTQADNVASAIVPWALKAGDTISVQCSNNKYKSETQATEPGWPGVGIDIYKGTPSSRAEFRALDMATTGNAYQFIF